MFKFLPFGGVGYIGGNISYMEIDGFPFLIDTGILFPREESLGINYLYPNTDLLDSDSFKTPEYLFLTHAHEDHIGGLRHLLKKYPRIKIICSEYTILFIEKKFPDYKAELINVADFSREGFTFFNLRHSIPGVYGFHHFSNNLDLGILFCTDFRFDVNENDQSFLNPKMLKDFSKIGSKKITFLDSTNICSSNDSGPMEKDIVPALKKEITETKSDIYMTMFPSNTERLGYIIDIANDLNRSVRLCGFSVEFSYNLGLKAGIVKPIKNKEMSHGTINILSGSQGDLRGAFRRVFTGNDKKIKPSPDDKLLYSSKVIPGNEKSVGEMFNKASLLGLSINKGKDPVIHSSGHAYPSEILSIIDNFKPTDVCPIHLESSFFQDFNKVMKTSNSTSKVHRLENYKGIFIEKNSDFSYIELEPQDLKIYIDGGEEVEKGLLNNRRRLGISGSVFISISKDRPDSLLINSYGVPITNSSELKSKTLEILNNEWNSSDCSESVRIGVRQFLNKRIGYKPLVFVHIL